MDLKKRIDEASRAVATASIELAYLMKMEEIRNNDRDSGGAATVVNDAVISELAVSGMSIQSDLQELIRGIAVASKESGHSVHVNLTSYPPEPAPAEVPTASAPVEREDVAMQASDGGAPQNNYHAARDHGPSPFEIGQCVEVKGRIIAATQHLGDPWTYVVSISDRWGGDAPVEMDAEDISSPPAY